jgi:hypothetical protein
MKTKRRAIAGLFVSVWFLAQAASAGQDRGGGDLCEDHIKLVRDDLKEWIQKGGPNGLTLPSEISVARYSEQMLAAIDSTKIRCVGPNDYGFPVLVSGTPKVCRFDKSWSKNQITCDLAKFMSLSESERYVLIHHEYAGLTGFEAPNQDDSVYGISNQISEYLVDQTVKKLAVKQVNGSTITGERLADFKEYVLLAGERIYRRTCGMAGGLLSDPDEPIDDAIFRYIKNEINKATSATLSDPSGAPVWTIENPIHETAPGVHERSQLVIRVSPSDHERILSIELSVFSDRPRQNGNLLHPTYSRAFELDDFKFCKVRGYKLPVTIKWGGVTYEFNE